jgi:alkylation response protein AidB-like acyl-CoA dehydrogenase
MKSNSNTKTLLFILRAENLVAVWTEQDRQESFPRERWRKCAGFGVLGLPFPATYGGAEEDISTLAA